MKKITPYMVMAVLCLFFKAQGQSTSTLKGRVVDAQSQPLPNVTIKIADQNLGITDKDGQFTVRTNLLKGVLSFSAMGYKTQTLAFEGSKSNVLINLQEETAALQEVQVVSTGYQTLPKERATGSFTVVDEKTLSRAVSPDLLSRLKGVTNGLLFDNTVGNATGISVRGRSTIFSNTTPLIVVDNFPFEGDLNTLNPDIIESVTLLKDAAAASIWGVRAGNGVLVITTKKGSLNASPKVSFNANMTVGDKPDLYYEPQLSSSQYVDIERFLFEKGAYNATINNGWATISPVVDILQKIRADPSYAAQGNAEIDALRNNDIRPQLEKYFYRNSVMQHYAADVRGGGNNQTYFVSAGYDHTLANLLSQADDRFTLRGRNHYSLFKDRLKINTDISFSRSMANNTNAYNYTPYLPYEQIADSRGDALATVRVGGLRQSYIATAGNGLLLDWNYRPLEELRNQGSTQLSQLTDYRLNLGLNYQIISPLSFSLNYQYYNASTKLENTRDRDSYYVRNLVNTFSRISSATGEVNRPVPYGGIYSPSFISRQSNYGRVQLSFSEMFGQKHELSAICGYELRDDAAKRNAYTVYGYSPETGAGAIVDLINPYPSFFNPNSSARISAGTSQGATVDRYISMYGNASYSYGGRYMVSGSYRKDESNLFGVKANQKGVPLWSAGLAWNIHKEAFFNLGWLSSLQLKASYGYNGNVNNSVSAYLTATSSTYNPYGALGFEIVNPPNDNLRWERVKNTNMGLYFATHGNWLTGSMEYFVKRGTDLIGTSPIAPQTGISLFTGNTADTRAQGIDLQLNSRNINGKFIWGTSFILNYVRDRIVNYRVAAGSNASVVIAATNSLSPIVGYPINSVFAYRWAGLDANGNPQGYLNGAVSTDYTAIRNTNDYSQLHFMGSATPTLFGGIRNTFGYQHFELSFNITYKFDYYFRRASLSNSGIYSGNYKQRDYDRRWQNPGDELLTDVPALVYPNVPNRNDFYSYAAAVIEKGDHIRLQDVQLNYTLASTQNKKLPFSNVNLYVYANNLGILWRANREGIDPDFRRGFPTPRTIAFGLRTNF